GAPAPRPSPPCVSPAPSARRCPRSTKPAGVLSRQYNSRRTPLQERRGRGMADRRRTRELRRAARAAACGLVLAAAALPAAAQVRGGRPLVIGGVPVLGQPAGG